MGNKDRGERKRQEKIKEDKRKLERRKSQTEADARLAQAREAQSRTLGKWGAGALGLDSAPLLKRPTGEEKVDGAEPVAALLRLEAMKTATKTGMRERGITHPDALGLIDRLQMPPEGVGRYDDIEPTAEIIVAKGFHPELYKLLHETRTGELPNTRTEELAKFHPEDQLFALTKEAAYEDMLGPMIKRVWDKFIGWVEQNGPGSIGAPFYEGPDRKVVIRQLPPQMETQLTNPPFSMTMWTIVLKNLIRNMWNGCMQQTAAEPDFRAVAERFRQTRAMMLTEKHDLQGTMGDGFGTSVKHMPNMAMIDLELCVQAHGGAAVTPDIWMRAIAANGTHTGLLSSQTNIWTFDQFDATVTRPLDPMYEAGLVQIGLLNPAWEQRRKQNQKSFYSLYDSSFYRFADTSMHTDIRPDRFDDAKRRHLRARNGYTSGCPANLHGVVTAMYKWHTDVMQRYAAPHTQEFVHQIIHNRF